MNKILQYRLPKKKFTAHIIVNIYCTDCRILKIFFFDLYNFVNYIFYFLFFLNLLLTYEIYKIIYEELII